MVEVESTSNDYKCGSYFCREATKSSTCDHQQDCWHCGHSIKGNFNFMGFPEDVIGCKDGLNGYLGGRELFWMCYDGTALWKAKEPEDDKI